MKENKSPIGDNSFRNMKNSLKKARADFSKRILLAKTIAPMLKDQSSNQAHLATIFGNEPLEEKVISVLMLGFPQNREMLPVLDNLLTSGEEILKVASIIAICQMKDRHNHEILAELLLGHLENGSPEIKSHLLKALKNLKSDQSGPISSSENSTMVTWMVEAISLP